MPVMQSGIVPPSNDTKVRAPLPEIKDKIQETRSKIPITARQCRGARGLLGMSQRDLAVASGVHLQTLLDFVGHRIPRGPTMQAIARALEDAGIVFIPREWRWARCSSERARDRANLNAFVSIAMTWSRSTSPRKTTSRSGLMPCVVL